MTLRQKKMLQELPKNNYNFSATARKVGYSESYAATGQAARILRKNIDYKRLFEPEQIEKDIEQHRKRCLRAKDYVNVSRMIELKSKVTGMQVDKVIIKHSFSDDEKSEYEKIKAMLCSPA